MVNIYKQKGIFLAKARFVPAWRGLMFCRKLGRGEAIIMDVSKYPPFMIHMVFVFQTIDVAFLDHNYKVIEVCKNIKPFSLSFRPKLHPWYVIEGSSLDLKVGDRLRFAA